MYYILIQVELNKEKSEINNIYINYIKISQVEIFIC